MLLAIVAHGLEVCGLFSHKSPPQTAGVESKNSDCNNRDFTHSTNALMVVK